jgi:hypothetical protein
MVLLPCERVPQKIDDTDTCIKGEARRRGQREESSASRDKSREECARALHLDEQVDVHVLGLGIFAVAALDAATGQQINSPGG